MQKLRPSCIWSTKLFSEILGIILYNSRLDVGDTHTGALQVAVPFTRRHSGSHSAQVLFTTASRGSLQKQ